MGLRDAILAAEDAVIQPLSIPEWGVDVHIRTMQASERDAFEARQQRDPYKDLRARLAVATVCDESGALTFTEADVPSLGQKNAKALDRIFEAASKLNRLTKDDVDELRKNS